MVKDYYIKNRFCVNKEKAFYQKCNVLLWLCSFNTLHNRFLMVNLRVLQKDPEVVLKGGQTQRKVNNL